ncbi:MAG: hypothetical protein E7107_11515 [Prevotella sp.]|jgi:hypothetical protein|nr:hypothetical protein [Prevotella sp.]
MFCYQKNFFNPTLPVDEAQFFALVRATQWNEAIDKFRETGDQKLKRGLPAFIFQATFDETVSKNGKAGRWRKQAATKLTGLVVMDVDHIDDPLGLVNEKLGMSNEKWAALGVLLVYITPSGKGLKIVFKADAKKGNLIDNQHAMAKVLGVEVDESCKDASRMSFICKESDILYLNKELFTYENKDFAEKYDAEYRAGHSSAIAPVALASKVAKQGDAAVGHVDAEAVSLNFKGRPYSEIIDEWWARNGGVPQEGERNVKLYQLAVSLRAICDNDKSLLLQVMPRLGLDEEELQRIVESACKEPPKGISKPMREILGMTTSAAIASDDMAQWLWDWGAQIEELFEYFPILKDVCKGLKRNQYPAALIVSGAFEMTLMTRCTYRFYHRPEELRRLNSSALIIGDPASGKSFATRLFKLLAAPIVAADKVGRDAINAYREQMRTKGANKEKPKKPKVVVRVHPARTSNAQFIQDMVNAVETVDGEEMHLHMLTFDTELDNTVTVQKGGSWIDKQSLELKAFHNEEDGQAYSNMDSILQDFNVYWNYVYTGTPIALKKKVNEQNFGSGLATRLTCIPLPATNFEMMSRENTVDFESDARIKAWAEKLDRMKGELSVQKIVDELYDWTARRMMDAAENDSRADEMLLKRCAYHGLNYAAPFIVMRHWDKIKQDGNYWCGEFETDEIDWRLTELIVNMQFACQRHYFGAMAEAYFDNKLKDASVNVQRRQKTFEGFARLPEEFTNEDVMRCFNLSSEGAARMKIKRLLSDHLIEKLGDGRQAGASKSSYRKSGNLML